MPNFYFNLHRPDRTEEDNLGMSFHSLEEAYLAVYETMEIQAGDIIASRGNPFDCAYVISDERGVALMDIPFADLLSGKNMRVRPRADAIPKKAQNLLDKSRRLRAASDNALGRARRTRANAELALSRSQNVIAGLAARKGIARMTGQVRRGIG